MDDITYLHNFLTGGLFALFCAVCVIVNKFSCPHHRVYKCCKCEGSTFLGKVTPSNNFITITPDNDAKKVPLYQYLAENVGQTNPTCQSCCAHDIPCPSCVDLRVTLNAEATDGATTSAGPRTNAASGKTGGRKRVPITGSQSVLQSYSEVETVVFGPSTSSDGARITYGTESVVSFGNIGTRRVPIIELQNATENKLVDGAQTSKYRANFENRTQQSSHTFLKKPFDSNISSHLVIKQQEYGNQPEEEQMYYDAQQIIPLQTTTPLIISTTPTSPQRLPTRSTSTQIMPQRTTSQQTMPAQPTSPQIMLQRTTSQQTMPALPTSSQTMQQRSTSRQTMSAQSTLPQIMLQRTTSQQTMPTPRTSPQIMQQQSTSRQTMPTPRTSPQTMQQQSTSRQTMPTTRTSPQAMQQQSTSRQTMPAPPTSPQSMQQRSTSRQIMPVPPFSLQTMPQRNISPTNTTPLASILRVTNESWTSKELQNIYRDSPLSLPGTLSCTYKQETLKPEKELSFNTNNIGAPQSVYNSYDNGVSPKKSTYDKYGSDLRQESTDDKYGSGLRQESDYGPNGAGASHPQQTPLLSGSSEEEIVEHTVQIKVRMVEATSKDDIQDRRTHETASGTQIVFVGPTRIQSDNEDTMLICNTRDQDSDKRKQKCPANFPDESDDISWRCNTDESSGTLSVETDDSIVIYDKESGKYKIFSKQKLAFEKEFCGNICNRKNCPICKNRKHNEDYDSRNKNRGRIRRHSTDDDDALPRIEKSYDGKLIINQLNHESDFRHNNNKESRRCPKICLKDKPCKKRYDEDDSSRADRTTERNIVTNRNLHDDKASYSLETIISGHSLQYSTEDPSTSKYFEPEKRDSSITRLYKKYGGFDDETTDDTKGKCETIKRKSSQKKDKDDDKELERRNIAITHIYKQYDEQDDEVNVSKNGNGKLVRDKQPRYAKDTDRTSYQDKDNLPSTSSTSPKQFMSSDNSSDLSIISDKPGQSSDGTRVRSNIPEKNTSDSIKDLLRDTCKKIVDDQYYRDDKYRCRKYETSIPSDGLYDSAFESDMHGSSDTTPISSYIPEKGLREDDISSSASGKYRPKKHEMATSNGLFDVSSQSDKRGPSGKSTPPDKPGASDKLVPNYNKLERRDSDITRLYKKYGALDDGTNTAVFNDADSLPSVKSYTLNNVLNHEEQKVYSKDTNIPTNHIDNIPIKGSVSTIKPISSDDLSNTSANLLGDTKFTGIEPGPSASDSKKNNSLASISEDSCHVQCPGKFKYNVSDESFRSDKFSDPGFNNYHPKSYEGSSVDSKENMSNRFLGEPTTIDDLSAIDIKKKRKHDIEDAEDLFVSREQPYKRWKMHDRSSDDRERLEGCSTSRQPDYLNYAKLFDQDVENLRRRMDENLQLSASRIKKDNISPNLSYQEDRKPCSLCVNRKFSTRMSKKIYGKPRNSSSSYQDNIEDNTKSSALCIDQKCRTPLNRRIYGKTRSNHKQDSIDTSTDNKGYQENTKSSSLCIDQKCRTPMNKQVNKDSSNDNVRSNDVSCNSNRTDYEKLLQNFEEITSCSAENLEYPSTSGREFNHIENNDLIYSETIVYDGGTIQSQLMEDGSKETIYSDITLYNKNIEDTGIIPSESSVGKADNKLIPSQEICYDSKANIPKTPSTPSNDKTHICTDNKEDEEQFRLTGIPVTTDPCFCRMRKTHSGEDDSCAKKWRDANFKKEIENSQFNKIIKSEPSLHNEDIEDTESTSSEYTLCNEDSVISSEVISDYDKTADLSETPTIPKIACKSKKRKTHDVQSWSTSTSGLTNEVPILSRSNNEYTETSERKPTEYDEDSNNQIIKISLNCASSSKTNIYQVSSKLTLSSNCNIDFEGKKSLKMPGTSTIRFRINLFDDPTSETSVRGIRVNKNARNIDERNNISSINIPCELYIREYIDMLRRHYIDPYRNSQMYSSSSSSSRCCCCATNSSINRTELSQDVINDRHFPAKKTNRLSSGKEHSAKISQDAKKNKPVQPASNMSVPLPNYHLNTDEAETSRAHLQKENDSTLVSTSFTNTSEDLTQYSGEKNASGASIGRDKHLKDEQSYHIPLEDANMWKRMSGMEQYIETVPQSKAMRYFSGGPSTNSHNYGKFYPYKDLPCKRPRVQRIIHPSGLSTISFPSNRPYNCFPKKHICYPVPPNYNTVVRAYPSSAPEDPVVKIICFNHRVEDNQPNDMSSTSKGRPSSDCKFNKKKKHVRS